MLSIKLIFTILTVHWLADFALQTHWQATNKWNNWKALLAHTSTYTLVLMLAFGHNLPWAIWAFSNGVAHGIIDCITSKCSHKLFDKNDYHNGFVVIGLDQLLHIACLLWSISLYITYRF